MKRIEPVYGFLAPAVRTRFLLLSKKLYEAHQNKETKTLFRVFEIYRSPERQQHVYREGKSKAQPMESPHQYGLAADFVPYVDGQWSWAPHHDYAFLKQTARTVGLDVPIAWDHCHVEAPEWQLVRRTLLRDTGGAFYNGG